jgi:hypothetical protein
VAGDRCHRDDVDAGSEEIRDSGMSEVVQPLLHVSRPDAASPTSRLIPKGRIYALHGMGGRPTGRFSRSAIRPCKI